MIAQNLSDFYRAKAVISSLKEDKDFLKGLREWREKLIKKLRK
jgi:hypothetical protein